MSLLGEQAVLMENYLGVFQNGHFFFPFSQTGGDFSWLFTRRIW